MRRRGKVPTEECAVPVLPGPGEQVEDDGLVLEDPALAPGVLQVAANVGEGGQSEAGVSDARDDVGGLGRFVGIPVVSGRIRRCGGA